MTSPTPTRILLVDDHEVVRRGLRALLETHAGWEVCGEASDGRTAVRLAISLQPQIVVMDLSMPNLNGFDAAHQIISRLRKIQVLILSMHESEQLVREVLSAGVRGYILKSDAGRDLITGVEALERGETFFTSRIASRIHAREFSGSKRSRTVGRKGPLTPREREILQLIAEGRTNREVGTHLKISVKTAETHRARIMRKLGVESFAELVRYAIRNRIIEP